MRKTFSLCWILLGTASSLRVLAGCSDADEAPPTGDAGGPLLDATTDASTGADGSRDAVSDTQADARGDAPVSDGPLSDGSRLDAEGGSALDGSDAAACPAPVLPALKIVNVTSTTFANGYFAAQPPGSEDWYVTEQQGTVRIVRGGVVLSTPFISMTAAMGSGYAERGLLSIAFHPNYAANGRFFLMGTPAGGDGSFAPANADAVVEYARSANPDVATPTKVQDLLVLPASAVNHNGGTALFGSDGYLYVGTGDGGGGCESDQPGASQNPASLFGKILRLNVDGTAPFAAPGNPFASDTRVLHYGLRNPFRFTFDSVTGDLYIGDVGQDTHEEISVSPAGASATNFGWPAIEGSETGTCPNKVLGGPSPAMPPLVSTTHNAGAFGDFNSIVGGKVYRGTAIPSLQGVYLFSDVGGSRLGAVRYCSGQASPAVSVDLSQIPTPTGTLSQVTSFAEGRQDGELYLTYGLVTSRLGKLVLQ